MSQAELNEQVYRIVAVAKGEEVEKRDESFPFHFKHFLPNLTGCRFNFLNFHRCIHLKYMLTY